MKNKPSELEQTHFKGTTEDIDSLSIYLPVKTEHQKWRVDYDNDTGPGDEGFWEWWEITDGKTLYTSRNEEAAKELCEILNNQKQAI
ncbi:MAG: hypothetical protein ACI9JN_001274 [Bacteroidia bacterium]|jgi:hypothetical protein